MAHRIFHNRIRRQLELLHHRRRWALYTLDGDPAWCTDHHFNVNIHWSALVADKPGTVVFQPAPRFSRPLRRPGYNR